MSFNTCPICQAVNSETIHTLDCGNMDNSKLYPTVRLIICLHCGHAFNELSDDEIDGLKAYYNIEYAPTNLSATDMIGDRPGSTGKLTIDRYRQLYDILSPHIREKHEILDVGCAMGGFLDYLRQKGFCKLSGVDMSEIYVDQARTKNLFRIEHGNAESLPFSNHTFDVVVMEQVLEHLVNPIRAFKEARRVLRKGGVFCIGVPDASKYSNFYFFDFYWLLLREHIQHFDVKHLRLLAMQEGFELLEHHQTVHFVMSERMIMPNLYIIFRSTDSVDNMKIKLPNDYNLKQYMVNYIDKEKSRQLMKNRKIAKLAESNSPVYAWGIGREFLYLHESVGLRNCNIAGLIDINPIKQKACSIGGMKIVDDSILRKASADSVLLITAIAHTDSIKRAVRNMDYKGKIFDLNVNTVST